MQTRVSSGSNSSTTAVFWRWFGQGDDRWTIAWRQRGNSVTTEGQQCVYRGTTVWRQRDNSMTTKGWQHDDDRRRTSWRQYETECDKASEWINVKPVLSCNFDSWAMVARSSRWWAAKFCPLRSLGVIRLCARNVFRWTPRLKSILYSIWYMMLLALHFLLRNNVGNCQLSESGSYSKCAGAVCWWTKCLRGCYLRGVQDVFLYWS